MRTYRENVPYPFVASNKDCRKGFALLSLLLLALWPAASSMGQAGSASTASQTPSQSGSEPTTTAQTDSGNQPQSLGDAARKANAQKEKPKSKHVFTDEDMSSVGGTISVVGDGSSGANSPESRNSSTGPQEDSRSSSTAKDEAYWRGKAGAIKDQIAAVDEQIQEKRDEITKAGPTSFDTSTGLSQNVIIVHDRNAELKELEQRKQKLETQLDDLADQGRKAGADSGWFR